MSPKMATAVLMAILAPRGAKGDALPTPRLDGLPCAVGCEDCAGNGKGQCSQSGCGADAVEFGEFHCTLPWNGTTTPVRCCLPKECTSDGDCEEGKICSEKYTCREPSCTASGGTCRAPDMAQAGPGGNTPPACLPGEQVKYYERSTCYSECGYFWGQCGESCCVPAAEGAGAEEGSTTTEGAAAGSSRNPPALPEELAPVPAATLPTPGAVLPGLLPPNVPPGMFSSQSSAAAGSLSASSATSASSSGQSESREKAVLGPRPRPVLPGRLPPYVPPGMFSSQSSASAASLPAAEGASSATSASSSGQSGSRENRPVLPGLLPPNVPPGMFSSPRSAAGASLPDTVSKAALWGPPGGSLGGKETSPVTAWVSSEVACLALVALLALLLLRRVETARVQTQTFVEQEESGLLQRTSE